MTTFPDIPFEAAVLRSMLLVGLVREPDVQAWAESLLATDADAGGHLADVVLARAELTELREALRPLAECAEVANVTAAVLTFLAVDPSGAGRSVREQVRILALLRTESMLSSRLAADVKLFEDRLMLASAGVGTEQPPSAQEVAAWLNAIKSAPYYRSAVAQPDECAAFLGALTRKVVRDRRWGSSGDADAPRAWVVPSSDTAAAIIMMNESLWQTAVREFSPLPTASRLAYADLPAGAIMIMGEECPDSEKPRPADGLLPDACHPSG